MKHLDAPEHPMQNPVENNETELRAYLLGRASEETVLAIEGRVLDDEDFYETLASVEDDLLDDAGRGRLSREDQAAFESRYRRDDERRGFSRAFVRGLSRAKQQKRAGHFRIAAGSLALAATLVVGFALLQEPPKPPSSPERAAPTPQAAARVGITLDLWTDRSSGTTARLDIPPGATTVSLTLRLDPRERFDRYAAEIKSKDEIAFRMSDLEPRRSGESLLLHVDVPASALLDGVHIVSIVGSRGAGAGEPVGFVSLRVGHTP